MSQQNQYHRVYEQREKETLEKNEIHSQNRRLIDGSIERTQTEKKSWLETFQKNRILTERVENKPGKELEKFCVQEISPKFKSMAELIEFKETAWDKLDKTSSLGKKFLDQSGGREMVKNNMRQGISYFLTKSANACEQIKETSPIEEGNVIHKLAELYRLERQPKSILEGKKYVEQSIYYKHRGCHRRCEVDYIAREHDGSVVISDYKRVNLSKFEETTAGRRWVVWAKKTVGPNFRELIREGSDPLFVDVRKDLAPKDVQEGFLDFMDRFGKKHQEQLDLYRRLFSDGSKVPLNKISTQIVPYYVFGK